MIFWDHIKNYEKKINFIINPATTYISNTLYTIQLLQSCSFIFYEFVYRCLCRSCFKCTTKISRDQLDEDQMSFVQVYSSFNLIDNNFSKPIWSKSKAYTCLSRGHVRYPCNIVSNYPTVKTERHFRSMVIIINHADLVDIFS